MDDVDEEDKIEKGDDHMHWKTNQHGKDEEKQNINMKDENQILKKTVLMINTEMRRRWRIMKCR